jgi:DNA primase large subunit
LKTELLLTTEDLRKYPFVSKAFERVRSLNLTLADLASHPLRNVVERAAAYVKAAVNGSEPPPPSDDSEEEVLAFAVALILLKAVGDRSLTRKFAVIFSRRVGRFLAGEDLSKLVYVLSELGVKARVLQAKVHGYPIAFHVLSYLESTPERAGHWKLVHRLVERGWVYVSKLEAARLGEEALKKFIERKVEEIKLDEVSVPDAVYRLVEGLSAEWGARIKELRERWAPEGLEASEDAFPPCIKAIVEDLKAGKNVPHSARFALASFLLSIGMSVDEVLEVFRAAPDFNEKIARYQVEHIAGMRGSGKKYTPYKCDNMRTLGLCVAECGVKHPLQYYWKALRRQKAPSAARGSRARRGPAEAPHLVEGDPNEPSTRPG